MIGKDNFTRYRTKLSRWIQVQIYSENWWVKITSKRNCLKLSQWDQVQIYSKSCSVEITSKEIVRTLSSVINPWMYSGKYSVKIISKEIAYNLVNKTNSVYTPIIFRHSEPQRIPSKIRPVKSTQNIFQELFGEKNLQRYLLE